MTWFSKTKNKSNQQRQHKCSRCKCHTFHYTPQCPCQPVNGTHPHNKTYVLTTAGTPHPTPYNGHHTPDSQPAANSVTRAYAIANNTFGLESTSIPEEQQGPQNSTASAEQCLTLLTEEKPTTSTVTTLLKEYAKQQQKRITFVGKMQIIPTSSTSYAVTGVKVAGFQKIQISLVSGNGSFADYLIFEEENPSPASSKPVMIAEVTKTSDDESRNAVYQRMTKLALVRKYFKENETALCMLYNSSAQTTNWKQTNTNKFGSRLLATMGVDILGDTGDKMKSFSTREEMIEELNKINAPSQGTPLTLRYDKDKTTGKERIVITAKMANGTNSHGERTPAHDPNIGFLAGIAYVLREKFNFEGEILLTEHEISQEYLDRNPNNKFMHILKEFNISLEGVTFNEEKIEMSDTYWHYENSSEKVASIHLHTVLENNDFFGIYSNHAGCERGYFRTPKNSFAIPKKTEDGEKINIPDLVMGGKIGEEEVIYLLEAKKLLNMKEGLKQLENYTYFKDLIKEHYPHHRIISGLVTFGGDLEELPDPKSVFHMNGDGSSLTGQGLSSLQGFTPPPSPTIEG